MGLFGFLGELVTLPLDVAATTVRTTVKVAGAAVTLDPEAAERAAADATAEAVAKLERLEDEVDE